MPLTTPLVHVVLDDDTEHTVRLLNADLVAFDRQRGIHREWPSMQDGPYFYLTWCVWHALTRANLIPQWNFGEFERRALQVEGVDEEAVQEVDPTPTAAEPG